MMRQLLLLVALLVALSSQQGIITRTPTTLTVIEGQAAPTYTLALGAGSPTPTADVTVTLTQMPTGSLTLSPPGPVTLNAGTTSVTITVTANNDAAVQAQQSITISHTATSGDPAYNGISIGSVTVTKRDNDAFTAASSATSVDEGGNTFIITVTLVQATTANSATVTPAFPPGSWTSTPPSAVFPASTAANTQVQLTIKKGFDGAMGGARSIGFTVTSMDTLFSNQFIAPLTVTVNASPFQLVASPTDTSVVAGMTAYFNVQVTGSANIAWEREDAFAMPITKRQTRVWTVIPGANTATLTVTTTVASQTGVQYRAILTAMGGSTSRATTTPATLTITSSAAVAPAVMSGASGAGSSSSGAFGASGAAAFGDPHLIGWNGATFDFDGQNGRVYNLFSDAGVSINMRLGKLRASSRDFLPGVYMTEIGMQFDESRIHIAAGGPISQDMGSVVVDGHVLDLAHAYAQPLNISRHLFNGACSFEYSSPMQQATAWGIADEYERVTGAVVVRLGDSYTFTVLMLQRVGFYLLPRRTLAVIGNLDKNSLKSLPHGLLGQTARPEPDSDDSSRRRALSPAARAFRIEGSESDYEIQSEQIFGNDFAFSRFAKRR